MIMIMEVGTWGRTSIVIVVVLTLLSVSGPLFQRFPSFLFRGLWLTGQV